MASAVPIDIASEYRVRFDMFAVGAGADPVLVERIRQLISLERPDATLVDDLEAMLVGHTLPGQSVRALLQCLQASTTTSPDRARPLLQRAAEYAREDGDRLQLHTALICLAVLDCGAGRLDDATRGLGEAEQTLDGVDWAAWPLDAAAITQLQGQLRGHLHWLAGLLAFRASPPDLERAHDQLRRGIVAARDLPIDASMRLVYADVELARGSPWTAATALRRVRHLSLDPEERAEATIKLASCLLDAGDQREALAVLEAAPDEGNERHRVLRRGLLAAFALGEGVADEHIRDVVAAAQQLDGHDAAMLRVTAAEALADGARPRQARAHAAEGLRLLSEADRGSPIGARLRLVLARTELARGRIDEAVGHASGALASAAALGLWELRVEAARALTAAFDAQARHAESRRTWAELRRAARSAGDTGAEARALLGLTGAYCALGDAAQGAVLWRQALTLLDHPDAGARDVIELFELVPDGVGPDAVPLLEGALEDATDDGLEELEDRAIALLVEAQVAAGELAAAEGHARALVAKTDPRRRRREAAMAVRLLVDVVACNAPPEEALLRQALVAADACRDVWLRLRARVELGEWALATGRHAEAADVLGEASELSRDALVPGGTQRYGIHRSDVLHGIHSRLALAHHLLGDAAAAVDALERGRATLALQALLAERGAEGEPGLRAERALHAERAHVFARLDEAVDDEDDLLVDTLEVQLSELAQSLDDLDDARARDAPARAALQETRAVRLGDLQTVLDAAGAVALEFAVCDDVLLGALVTADDVRTFLVDAAPARLGELIAEARQALEGYDPDPPHLADLHSLLVAPVADLLDEEHLILVLDGALHALPFELLSPDGGPKPWRARELLVRRMSISRAPSLRVACVLLQFGPSRPPAAWSLAAAALDGINPTRGEGERLRLARLPSADREVHAIVEAVGAAAVAERALVGRAATRGAVRRLSEGDGDVLHLACHAFAHDEDPDLSAVQLTPEHRGSLADATWRAHEIAHHRTGHRIVVLSACGTGVGPVSAEGTLALSRAFLNAGAESVVASLWAVDDDLTARLMPQLHRSLVDGASPSAALRRMQLAALEDRTTAQPWAWAAFCVHGMP